MSYGQFLYFGVWNNNTFILDFFDYWFIWHLGEGNGNPLQYSCLENPMMDKPGRLYSPWGHKESDMTEQLLIYLLFIILASVFWCCDLHLHSLPILALGCLDFLLICNYSLYMWDPKPFWLYALERSSLSLWAIFQFWYTEFKHVNVNSFFYKLCFCLLIKKLFCSLKSWKYASISYSSNFELLLFKYRSLWKNKCKLKFKCIILKTQNYGFSDIWGIG